MKIVVVGHGNVATHLTAALRDKGFALDQVSGRTLEQLDTQADVYIFAIKDSALAAVLERFPRVEGLLVHTAGSIPMAVFRPTGRERYGVLYPLQTFSKSRPIRFDHIPLFVEANTPDDEKLLLDLAARLSDRVLALPSDKRRYLHLAAVFACNFTNYMYQLAAQVLEKQDLPWDVLLPLITETAAKVRDLPPRDAQTGPAVRGDAGVMDAHLQLLRDDPDKQEIYRLLSRGIRQIYKD